MVKRVFFLQHGSFQLDRAQLLWNVDRGTPVKAPSYSVLIDHENGLFLFDTGFDLEQARAAHPEEDPTQEPGEALEAQLELCGYGVDDVSGIIHSHLHFDHVGGDRLLGSIPVFVSRTELRHLERQIISAFHVDPVAQARSMARVAQVQRAHGARLFFAHDMQELQGYTKAPDCYLAA